MKLPIFSLLFLVFASWCWAQARTWKSADGKRSFEGDFVRQESDKVTIRRTRDGKVFSIEIVKLSQLDQEWLKEQKSAKSEDASAKELDPEWAKLLTGDWERHEAHGMKFRLFGERKMRRSTSKAYPLVVYLHGKNGDVMSPGEPWNARIFSEKKNQRKRPCLVLAPQCPDFGWNGKKAEQVIKIIEDLMSHFPIDKKRIYLTGYSMGSFGTFNLLAQEPELFAAGIPVAGGVSPQIARKIKEIPVWVFHGDADEVVQVESSRKIVGSLKDEKGKVKYTEFPGAGHDITDQVYGDDEVHEWLFAQTR